VAIEDVQNIETLYAINIFVYELKEDEMGNGHNGIFVDFISVKCNVGQEVYRPFGVRTLLSDIF
jgi:hypothetical protein